MQDCILRLIKLNIKARHNLLEFLTANHLSIHVITVDKIGIEMFSFSTIFAQFLLSRPSNSEKVRIENLKFRTDLLDQVMNGWSLTQEEMIVYGGRLPKKNRQIKN